MLVQSKLNSIETLISQALDDIEISHEEFIIILKEKDKHEKMNYILENENENEKQEIIKKNLNNLLISIINMHIYCKNCKKDTYNTFPKN